MVETFLSHRAHRYQEAFEFAQRQAAATLERTPDYFPIYTVGGRWHHAGELWTDWTGGFLYGFSQVYAQTGREEFLEVSERNAGFWLRNLPADGIPYWDFRADLAQPLPWGPQKDSSAAAIAACGLWDLAAQSQSLERAEGYRTTALAMLDRLVEPEYLAIETPGWEGVLKHGVYHTRKNLGLDVSVTWGDFFLVEALAKVLANPRSA